MQFCVGCFGGPWEIKDFNQAGGSPTAPVAQGALPLLSCGGRDAWRNFLHSRLFCNVLRQLSWLKTLIFVLGGFLFTWVCCGGVAKKS